LKVENKKKDLKISSLFKSLYIFISMSRFLGSLYAHYYQTSQQKKKLKDLVSKLLLF
jgi:hypothetical protein